MRSQLEDACSVRGSVHAHIIKCSARPYRRRLAGIALSRGAPRHGRFRRALVITLGVIIRQPCAVACTLAFVAFVCVRHV